MTKPRMSGARPSYQADQRPFRVPPRKAVHRKSYSIRAILAAAITVACVCALVWGTAASYQIGYEIGCMAREARHA